MNTFGRNLRVTIFGESHGAVVGAVIDGLPPGFKIDMDIVHAMLERRAPGRSETATARRETDASQVLSGMLEGRTTGAPLCVVFGNDDARSGDYNRDIPRPGHADWTARVRYNDHNDHRGGGMFSGRMTAPLVFAGAVCSQLLAARGVTVAARICSIADVMDGDGGGGDLHAVSRKGFAVFDDDAGARMRAAILEARQDGDSVGGTIECVALGVPAGYGDPFFGSVESVVSSMLFSIPAVKGVEFGDGFALAKMRGSEVNDGLRFEDGAVRVDGNHSGGINGGITNGNPLVVRVAVRPTPTIAREQSTVNLATGENITYAFGGRHDACIVPRAVAVVEAAVALCLTDFMLGGSARE